MQEIALLPKMVKTSINIGGDMKGVVMCAFENYIKKQQKQKNIYQVGLDLWSTLTHNSLQGLEST